MQKKPKITVAIVTRNRKKSLELLLTDLAKQTVLAEEIIIIENVNDQQLLNEKTIKKIIPKETSLNYQKISVKNMSPAPSRNLCLKEAKGDILMFLDDDIRINNDYLEKTIHYFNKFPKTLAIVPKIVSTSHDIWSKFSEAFFGLGQLNSLKETLRESFPTCASSLDLAELKKTKIYFDESINGAEDYLFSKQVLSKSEKKSIYIPSIVVKHNFKMNNSFKSFINRFNWYSKSELKLKIEFPEIFKNDLKYIEHLTPKRKLDIILFPIFLLKNFYLEFKGSYKRLNLNLLLVIPNLIYTFLITYNFYTNEKFWKYFKPKLKIIFRK